MTTHDSTPPADSAAQLRDKVNRALRNRGRLRAVENTGLLETTEPIPSLERIVRIAARALKAPAVQLTVLTDKMLHPVAVHLDPAMNVPEWRGPRIVGFSFAKYVVWSKQPFQVDDSHKSDLVKHSHAARDLDLIAFLGVPIMARGATGNQQHVIGSLSAIQSEPRAWTADDMSVLSDLAALASDEIELRRRATSEARSLDEHKTQLMEGIAVGVLGTDAKGVITYANPAAETMLGYSGAELVGHDTHALIHHTHADGRRYLESECPNISARREGRELHVRGDTFWRADGSPLAVDATMTPIYERGELSGSVLTFVDIAARQAAEEVERAGRDAAEAANRAKSGLISSMTEELDGAVSQLSAARERSDLAAIHESERLLAALVASMRHVAGLDEREPATIA